MPCKHKLSKMAKAKADPANRYWLHKADLAWRKKVLEQFGFQCAVCGETKHLNAHHLFDRSRKDTRHIFHNGIALCPLHHKWGRQCSPHRGPVMFFRWFANTRPWQWDWLSSKIEEPVGYKPNYRERYIELTGED